MNYLGFEDNYYIAMYPYESNEPGDLSFVAGEMVTIIKKDGDWWTGTIGARTGVFPSNYVQKAELQYEAAADSEVEAASAAADAAAAASVAKIVAPAVKTTNQVDSKRPNTAPIDGEFEVFYYFCNLVTPKTKNARAMPLSTPLPRECQCVYVKKSFFVFCFHVCFDEIVVC